MSEQTRQQVTIAVDLKKYRIRIHRSTLALLGTPKYVQFLVSPSAMMLAIQGTDKRTNYTHRVNLAALHPDNSYEIYSTSFVNKLCSLMEGLDRSLCRDGREPFLRIPTDYSRRKCRCFSTQFSP